jgi:mRNA interferase RelE/StbE
MQFVFYENAQRDLKKMDKVAQQQIKKRLDFLRQQDNPMQFATRLTNFKGGDYRFRAGVYRIVFVVEDDTVLIVRIQHRSEVYRRLR